MQTKVIEAINKCIEANRHELLKLGHKRVKTADILDYKIKFLEYMRDNALGNKNAKPLDVVMNKIGYQKSKNYFQQSIVIKFKKEGNIFIGSSANGIFVVVSKEDAMLASEFYVIRIKSEYKHLSNLIKYMKTLWRTNKYRSQLNINRLRFALPYACKVADCYIKTT